MEEIVDPNVVGISNGDINVVENSAAALARSGNMDIMDLLKVVDRLNEAGRKASVQQLYRIWVDSTTSPFSYLARFNLAVLVSADGNHAEAERLNRSALEVNPDLLQARLNLGNNLEQLGRQEEALDQWRSVLTHPTIDQPDNKPLILHALNNLGRLLETRREFSESLRYLEKSLEVDPTQVDVLLHAGHLRQKQCIWPLNLFREAKSKDEMVVGCSPLALLAATSDPELQLGVARWFDNHKFAAETRYLAPREGYRHDKIRIGYLSSDFCMHAVSLLTVELFELHDRERFEVYGFCWSREDGTPLRARVIKAMDHFIKIGSMTDQQAAECIRSHEIDVLVDLHGLTSGARPLILSHRPAPVQMTYLGFPGTTGLPWLDYVIADRYLIPEKEALHYSEKPLYLPNCFQVSDSKRPVGPKPTRSANNLPEKGFVFCAFNNNYKFTPELFAVWMRILKRVPGSVLWLLADNEWSKENLLRTAKQHGIKKERLVFASRVQPPDYLARYQIADLFLDTCPFNGGTTANDALFMGLPLLTLSGRTFASRMAGSLLTDLGLPELITATLKDYEERAVALAKAPRKLAELKARLDEARKSGRTFNIPAVVKEYEAAVAGVALSAEGAAEAVDTAAAPVTNQQVQPVTQNDLLNFLNHLRPWNLVNDTKVRVGGNAGGGYVGPSAVLSSSLVVSIGPGCGSSFEIQLAERGARVLQFDPAREHPPVIHRNIQFFRQGWGAPDQKGDNASLRTLLMRADWTGSRCPVLKFDLRGGEWEALQATEPEVLERFDVMVAVFRDLSNLLSRNFFDRANAIFEKLERTHQVVHLHADNEAGLILIGGIPFPRVVELTLVRKKVAVFAGHSSEPIPGALDRPNVPHLPDLYLRAF